MRVGFAMPTLADGETPIEVPAPGDQPLAAMALFGDACRLISTELHRRYDANAENREWLQRVAYQLIGQMISNGFAGLFEERIVNFGRKRTAASRQINPFQKGLLATFAHDKGVMNEQKRHIFGLRLWYAYRHYVPHEFLTAFLGQVWSDGADQRAIAEYIDPDFASWVMFERAADPAPERRGLYPVSLEEQVELVRKLSPAFERKN